MVTNVALSHYTSAASELRKPRMAEPAPLAPGDAPSASAASTTPAEPTDDARPEILPLDSQAFASAVKDITEKVQNFQRSLQFHVDEDSGRTIITVIDKETDEVIRQIPPEEVLTLAEQFRRGGGLFVETEA